MAVFPSERRKFVRLDYRIPLRYRKIETNAWGFKGCLIRNISEGGARVINYEFLPLNSKLAIEIPLIAGRKAVEGLSRVVWIVKTPFSEQYDIGLAFINLEQADSGQISNFVFNQSIQGLR